MCIGVLLMATGEALVALAGGPLPNTGVGLVAGQFVTGVGLPQCTIGMVSRRQSITAVELLGRVNATTRLLAWSAVPLGALLGGALGEAIGLRPTLALSAGGRRSWSRGWCFPSRRAPCDAFRGACDAFR
jgi:hypothetical protein